MTGATGTNVTLFSLNSQGATAQNATFLADGSIQANIFAAEIVISRGGRVRNLFVQTYGATGAQAPAAQLLVEFYLNGVAVVGSPTVVITSPATSGSDTVNSFTVVAGDRIAVRFNSGGNPNVAVAVGFSVVTQ